MKCSIIVPTFQRHQMLLHALETCAAQDYPKDQYEVIVVNDGGKGTNRHNVRAAWKSKVLLKYSSTAHRGLSAAINHGLRKASGEYFTIVPDDDGILRNKLRVMCGFLDAHPEVNVAYSLPKYVGADGKTPIEIPDQLRQYLRSHPIVTWKHVLAGHGLWVHGTGTVYRRSVIDEVGTWDEKLQTAEEYEWHLRLLHAGHDFHAIDAVTTLYRVHGGGKSNAWRQKRRTEQMRYIYKKFALERAPHKR
jgi:alpha-1,6-rhamnosyltransferase